MSTLRTPEPQVLLAGIRRWVEIETHTADAAGVNRLMDLVESQARAFGASVERIEGRERRGDHLSVRSPWGEGPGVLVLTHLDTVHPKGTLAEFPFRVEGDCAFGPGIYDMKGGAYLALAALGTLCEAGETTPLPIRILFTSDEEIGSPTSRALIEEAAKDAAYVLVTEPARDGGCCVTARKGVARFVMRVHGRPAHSGTRHHEGRSAIREMARQILDIEDMTDYEAGLTLSVGTVSGGTGINVIPAYAHAEIDARLPTLEAAERLISTMRNRKPYDRDVRIEITGGLNRPPFEKNEGTAALYERARALAAEIGFDLKDVSTGGGSDGNFTAPLAPTLDALGVDGEGAHTLEEHIFVSSLVPRMLLLRRLMQTLG